jgi:predicted AlkP superfamily pyrophosphatase or phosphodiesterase
MDKIDVILIDGFKPEYLKYAPYLSSLTNKYKWGELEVPFGHEGATEMVFKGHNDKISLFLKSEHSSLNWTKNFSWLEKFGDFGRLLLDSMINLIRYLKKEQLFRTGKIPLKKLYKFDFSVSHPAHYNLPVNFWYIGELDKIGHEYGTKSEEMISMVKKIDDKISKLDFDVIFSDHGMVDITETISVPETDKCFIDSDMARYWGNKEELEDIKKKLPLKI